LKNADIMAPDKDAAEQDNETGTDRFEGISLRNISEPIRYRRIK